MDVLIFEPEYGGHHFRWASYLVEAFLSRRDLVTLATTTQALASSEYHEHLERFRNRIEILAVRGLAPKRATCHRRARHVLEAVHLVRTVRRRRPDLVVVPYLDAMLIPLGILQLCGLGFEAHRRVDVIVMRGEFAYPEIRTTAHWRFHPKWRFKEWVLRKGLRSDWFSRVFVIDDIAYRHMQAWQRGRTELKFCPDPVSDSFPERDRARRELGLDDTVKILGSWGVLDSRKGVDLLLQAFAARAPCAEECLLLAGRLDPYIARQWAVLCGKDPSLEGRVVIADRFLSATDMRRYIAAVDVAAVVYPAHVGSSSVLLEAVAAGKPVLGSQFGWVGHAIRENRLGYCCDVRSPEALAKGLDWAFSAPRFDAERSRRLIERNTLAAFRGRMLGGDAVVE